MTTFRSGLWRLFFILSALLMVAGVRDRALGSVWIAWMGSWVYWRTGKSAPFARLPLANHRPETS